MSIASEFRATFVAILFLGFLLLSIAYLSSEEADSEDKTLEEHMREVPLSAAKEAATASATKEAKILEDLKAELDAKKDRLNKIDEEVKECNRVLGLSEMMNDMSRRVKYSEEVWQPVQNKRNDAMRDISEMLKKIEIQEAIAAQTARNA